MHQEKNLTGLKTLVISIGVLLVAGIAIATSSTETKAKPAGALPANCPGGEIDLKGKGHVVDTAVEGSTLRVAFAKPDGQIEMVHVDLCTGKQISALKISTDAP